MSVFGGGGAIRNNPVNGRVKYAQKRTHDIQIALMARDMIPAMPIRPIVARNTFKPWPGGETGARGP